jgi:potassium-transporting ATPase KdpC subunit
VNHSQGVIRPLERGLYRLAGVNSAREQDWVTARAPRALVKGAIEGRFLGLIGERRVNVLRLNLALDQLKSS